MKPAVRRGASRAQAGGSGVMRARRSTSWRTKSTGSGQGNPGADDLRLTVPCSATQIAVLSAIASVLADRPAVMHAASASTRSAKLSAPNASTGDHSGRTSTGLQ